LDYLNIKNNILTRTAFVTAALFNVPGATDDISLAFGDVTAALRTNEGLKILVNISAQSPI
jgi:hypothetical protein